MMAVKSSVVFILLTSIVIGTLANRPEGPSLQGLQVSCKFDTNMSNVYEYGLMQVPADHMPDDPAYRVSCRWSETEWKIVVHMHVPLSVMESNQTSYDTVYGNDPASETKSDDRDFCMNITGRPATTYTFSIPSVHLSSDDHMSHVLSLWQCFYVTANGDVFISPSEHGHDDHGHFQLIPAILQIVFILKLVDVVVALVMWHFPCLKHFDEPLSAPCGYVYVIFFLLTLGLTFSLLFRRCYVIETKYSKFKNVDEESVCSDKGLSASYTKV